MTDRELLAVYIVILPTVVLMVAAVVVFMRIIAPGWPWKRKDG